MNQSISVYEFSMNDTSNQHKTSQDTIVMFAPNIVSKAILIWLTVQSVRQNVEEITEMSHINPNGMVESMQEWSQIAFQDKTTGIINKTQQHACEVIMGASLMTFHNEAKRNVKTTGTLVPHNQHN